MSFADIPTPHDKNLPGSETPVDTKAIRAELIAIYKHPESDVRASRLGALLSDPKKNLAVAQSKIGFFLVATELFPITMAKKHPESLCMMLESSIMEHLDIHTKKDLFNLCLDQKNVKAAEILLNAGIKAAGNYSVGTALSGKSLYLSYFERSVMVCDLPMAQTLAEYAILQAHKNDLETTLRQLHTGVCLGVEINSHPLSVEQQISRLYEKTMNTVQQLSIGNKTQAEEKPAVTETLLKTDVPPKEPQLHLNRIPKEKKKKLASTTEEQLQQTNIKLSSKLEHIQSEHQLALEEIEKLKTALSNTMSTPDPTDLPPSTPVLSRIDKSVIHESDEERKKRQPGIKR